MSMLATLEKESRDETEKSIFMASGMRHDHDHASGDTRGHWAARVIGKWSDYGVIQVHNGNFNPDNPIARGDIAVVIDKHLDYQTEAENTFTDLGQLALSRSAVRSVALELFYIVQEYFERNDLPAARLLPHGGECACHIIGVDAVEGQ